MSPDSCMNLIKKYADEVYHEIPLQVPPKENITHGSMYVSQVSSALSGTDTKDSCVLVKVRRLAHLLRVPVEKLFPVLMTSHRGLEDALLLAK